MARNNEACRTASPTAAIAVRRCSETPPYSRRWLAGALAAVFMPKCVLCVAGYVAAGGAVVELCGGTPDNDSAVWLVGGAAAVVLLAVGRWIEWKKPRTLSGRGRPVR